jgi:hypothetical protein
MMKNLITFALAAIVFAACQESLEEKAAQEAKMYTQKNCPAMIGENLRMDSLTFEISTRTLHYYYTLSGIADTVGLLDEETARGSLLNELKNTTSMMAYKEAGYRFAYTYHSQKNPKTILFDMVFSEKDYNAKK